MCRGHRRTNDHSKLEKLPSQRIYSQNHIKFNVTKIRSEINEKEMKETIAKINKTKRKRYGDICICITDSLCYKAETNTPL